MKCTSIVNSNGSFKLNATFFCLIFLFASASAAPGRLDLTFPHNLNNGAIVAGVEIQPDGKILIAGAFTTTGAVTRKDIARFNADGTIDPTFDAGTGANNGNILSMKLQPDGKILIGGSFNSINGTTRPALARLNSDGSVDQGFEVSGINITFVFDIDLQTDGRILLSGMNLIGTSFVTRLTSSGVFEQGMNQLFFANVGGFNYSVTYVAAEEKILIGGSFTSGNNKNLIRIFLTGAIDTSFTANITSSACCTEVRSKPLDGGKILIWGNFDTAGQLPRKGIARLNSDGSPDPSFIPETAGVETISTVAVQNDGKIIIGGRGFAPNSPLRGNVARLSTDGDLDLTFYAGRGANGDVKVVRIQNTRKLLVGGSFLRFNNFPRGGLVRINL